MDRFKQICGDDFDEVMKHVLFFRPFSMSEQDSMVQSALKVAKNNDVGLVVMDSATAFYRLELGLKNDIDERQLLTQETMGMLVLARKRELPIVITSQVYTDSDTDTLRPIGGQALWHNAKAVIKLEKAGIGRRKATIMKHRSIPEGVFSVFRITNNGLEPEQAALDC